MLGHGYFISGIGTSINENEDVKIDNKGNIIFTPTDPIYIDVNNNVYFDDENRNSQIFLSDNRIYVKRVV